MINRVIKNNFISMGYHIIIVIIALNLPGLFSGLNNYKPLWPYYEVGQIFLATINVLLYLYAGFRFSPTKNLVTDILSFFLVGLIGILLWMYAFNVSHNTTCRLNMYNNDMAWWLYQIYYSVFVFIKLIIEEFTKSDFCEVQAYIDLIWILGPLLLFFTGIRIRRRYDRHHLTIESNKAEVQA